jgi:predicted nucleic acid-binding protein
MNEINIYVDSDVIVDSELEWEKNHSESKRLMDYLLSEENVNFVPHISVFSFVELASAMTRRTKDVKQAHALLYKIGDRWKRKGLIFPLTPIADKKNVSFTYLVEELIDVVTELKVPAADAIHAKTVAEYEIEYLITWNKKHFIGLGEAIKELKIRTPKEMMDEITNNKDKGKESR